MARHETDPSEIRTFLSIHGHFYQPPREDPFTGIVRPEFGADPFNDFCEKINAECYRPNAALGNFRRLSFNVGPTLADWLHRHDRETHDAIIASDAWSVQRTGVGSAMAQAYSHTILPLATQQEKRIQIAWGLADFAHRFGRRPEGMWLPETAVDTETLAVMADFGIEFTILAPWQAGNEVDSTSPYLVRLPGRRSISACFYDAPLSGQASFNPIMTVDAVRFTRDHLLARRNVDKLARGEPQLLMIATDGELYGHHQPFRDHFLSYLLSKAVPSVGFGVITPGSYLRQFPARLETTIRDATSWSCAHGVRRWRDDCGCTEGDGSWKWHLRHAFNRLAARIDSAFEINLEGYFPDPWLALEDYLSVRTGTVSWADFSQRHNARSIESLDHSILVGFFEAQYHRQIMFMSCSYFFEDLDRLEPRAAIARAARAISLIEASSNIKLTNSFVSDLAHARSNRSPLTGADLYRQVLPGHMETQALVGRSGSVRNSGRSTSERPAFCLGAD
ncbi:MAG TPA: DUF3536 domain-containing protein [Chloroflexota bacterium]|nr:DUF3536 domain-containing protein [Chloroflexota bacterium]